VVVREVTLAAPAAEVGEGGHSPPLFGRRGRRIPLPVHSQKALGSFEEPVMMVENRFAS